MRKIIGTRNFLNFHFHESKQRYAFCNELNFKKHKTFKEKREKFVKHAIFEQFVTFLKINFLV